MPGGTIAVIAPGTGLGEAYLTWDGQRYRTHASEGGHSDFAPVNETEVALLTYLQARLGRVSYERVCSGRGIATIYDFLRDQGYDQESPPIRAALASAKDRTPVIVDGALDPRSPDPLCLAALGLFASILGSETGNFVLKTLATGGCYISGGLVQRILPAISGTNRLFLSAFLEKGRLSPMLARVPVHVIVEPVALVGAALHGLDVVDAERSAA
jgi:glucokinase